MSYTRQFAASEENDPVDIPITIDGTTHRAESATIDLETGHITATVTLDARPGDEVAFDVRGYSGRAIVTAVHAPNNEPITTVLTITGPVERRQL